MTEEEVYDRLCVGCWRESLCHDDMEFCDEYLEETEEDRQVDMEEPK